MDAIWEYFNQLWFNQKEATIYLTLRKLWTKPASTIARVAACERVYTYKVLQYFVEVGIVAETVTKWVKHFWIPSLNLLAQYVLRHQQKYQSLVDQFSYIQTTFDALQKHTTSAPPRLQLFEQITGIKQLFEDMVQEIRKNNLITIKFFGTNTFETQVLSVTSIKEYTGNFLKFLEKQHITVQSYIAEWSLIMEHLTISETIKWLENLPAWNNAINLFVVGKMVYIIIYKEQPIGLKLESPELARAMHFLLEQTQK